MEVKWKWNGIEMEVKWKWNGSEMEVKWNWNGIEMEVKWKWNRKMKVKGEKQNQQTKKEKEKEKVGLGVKLFGAQEGRISDRRSYLWRELGEKETFSMRKEDRIMADSHIACRAHAVPLSV